MGTKKTSTTTNQYDPSSMNRYQGWQGSMYPQLQNLFSNPLASQFFNLNSQQQMKAATSFSGRNMQNALMNFGNTGVGSGLSSSGMRNQLLSGLNRYGSQLGYQGFMNAVNQAQSDRWNAASLGQSMFGQPLQTGQTNVQKTSGLGTWLPQVAGAGLAGLAAIGTGGASLLPTILGGAGGGTASALSQNPGAFGGPFNAPQTPVWNPMSNTNWNPNSGFIPGMPSGGINPFGMSPGIVPSPSSMGSY